MHVYSIQNSQVCPVGGCVLSLDVTRGSTVEWVQENMILTCSGAVLHVPTIHLPLLLQHCIICWMVDLGHTSLDIDCELPSIDCHRVRRV